MSTQTICNSQLNLEPLPLQESGSLLGKVVTKVHTTTNYAISSISSVAQFILSSCISVGTLGRYTLDDLKDYFSTTGSLEDISAVFSKGDEIKTTVSEFAEDLKESRSRLTRNNSTLSADYEIWRKFRYHVPNNTVYSNLYEAVAETLTLSTHQKTHKERLAKMEESAINGGK